MDANGGHSKAIARSLKKLGVKVSINKCINWTIVTFFCYEFL